MSGNSDGLLRMCRKDSDTATYTFQYLNFRDATGRRSIDGYNVTCLHVASARGRVGCCQVLLDFGARLEAEDSKGRTPLTYATTP